LYDTQNNFVDFFYLVNATNFFCLFVKNLFFILLANFFQRSFDFFICKGKNNAIQFFTFFFLAVFVLSKMAWQHTFQKTQIIFLHFFADLFRVGAGGGKEKKGFLQLFTNFFFTI
jgi:hypothetical protein